jgi:hypothetical protein
MKCDCPQCASQIDAGWSLVDIGIQTVLLGKAFLVFVGGIWKGIPCLKTINFAEKCQILLYGYTLQGLVVRAWLNPTMISEA